MARACPPFLLSHPETPFEFRQPVAPVGTLAQYPVELVGASARVVGDRKVFCSLGDAVARILPVVVSGSESCCIDAAADRRISRNRCSSSNPDDAQLSGW